MKADLPKEIPGLALHRTLLLCAGGGYLGWWFYVHAMLPSAFNPFWSRALVVASFFAAYGASHLWPAVARHMDAALLACCVVATAHFFYLFDANHADLNWMVGSYITVMVVCAILQTARSLLIYSLCVAVLSAIVNSRAQQLPYVVFMPGMLTILLFANIGLRGRLKTLEQRQRAEAALQRANSELESFSYSIAHDLRSPLRGMNGYAQILLEDYGDKLDAEARGHLDAIRNSAVRMAGIIDALLSLAGLSRREPKEEWVDLSDATRASAAALAQANPDRAVEVVVEDGLAALSDRQMFGTLIDNLLGNAWKFTQKASSPRIEFGSAEVAGAKALFVRDNGAGFDMAHAGKMFAPFQRLHEATEYPGYGIGLATVQRIVQRLGGRVWAEGVVNQGATFYFTLKDVRRS